jgi:hypothetical protein
MSKPDRLSEIVAGGVVDDVRAALDVYRLFPTDDLLHLRGAFTLDRGNSRSSTTQAFCTSRLAVIDTVLQERARGSEALPEEGEAD